MKLGLQIGGLVIALGIGAAMVVPCAAQNRNPKPPQQPKQEQKQAPRPERRQERQNARPPQNGRANAERPRNIVPPNRQTESIGTSNGGNRPPNAHSEPAQRPSSNPNRPPNATIRSRDLTPQQRQNWEKFSRLSPQEKQKLRDAQKQWERLTPAQQSHIKNDILPAYKQLPPARQKAIKSRLDVLQNMPESARNQHLNDPNFTKGMSEEDKAMLRDLSHMHVGAPDPPSE